MGIDLTCPQCGERMSFSLASTTVKCESCGYQRGTGLDARAAEIKAKGRRPTVSIANADAINPRALAIFNSGHDCLFLNNKQEALDCFKQALELQPDFLEAHLWIAKTSDDEKVKRDHLSSVLAFNPGHIEAMRLLLVLNGRLTPEQAARSYHSNDPRVEAASGPVTAQATTLLCPVCRGDLDVHDETGTVECRFCGYRGPKPRVKATGGDSLIAALLERKAQAVRWVIGERLLRCTECGAERTLAANQLTTRCPFCDSNHVMEQDALDSFEQPDGIIPFKVTREQAGAAIKAKLQGVTERVKGLFDNNKVARATLSGYYLPFWVFDAMIEITRTRIDNALSQDRTHYVAEPYTQMTFSDALHDIEVCAVKSPPPALTAQLGDFDLRDLVAYEPELLARYPAELYSLDFDQAALQARGLISQMMRAKYTRREMSDDQVSINVYSHIQQMSFQLALMPVWTATLIEQDRDVRSALVNGQTGKVVLGKAVRPER